MIPLIIYIGLLLLATAWPIPEMVKQTTFPYDKIVHFSMFFILSFLALRVLKRRDALILMIVIAIWSEAQQFFVPVRTAEIPDLIANLIGGSILFLVKL